MSTDPTPMTTQLTEAGQKLTNADRLRIAACYHREKLPAGLADELLALADEWSDEVDTLTALAPKTPVPGNDAGMREASDHTRKAVARAMDEDGGWWKSCTGCHETNEGHETGHYPYSELFRCHVGAGCSECGGLGVVWEYYSDEAFAAMAEELSPPTGSAGDDETGVREDCRLWWFLTVLQGAGGTACANGDRCDWTNAFCDDRGECTDTFNLASDRKLTTVSHDSDSGNSTVYITDAGCEYIAPQPPKAETPAGVGPDMSGWAKLRTDDCDHMMQIAAALSDLSEGYLEEAGVASETGEKNYELRDMHAHSILMRAANDMMDMIRALGPEGYFPRLIEGDPKLLTTARDHIRTLERQIAALSPAPAARAGDGVDPKWRRLLTICEAISPNLRDCWLPHYRHRREFMDAVAALTAAPAANGEDA